MSDRTIVLDIETTGLDVKDGHRIIEVGCVEMKDRKLTGNNLHLYLQPDRAIDTGALAVHGISNEFLVDKPSFSEVAVQLRDYLVGTELVMHNAPFDIAFLESEFERCDMPLNLYEICKITCTLRMARRSFPGQRNNLDALCKRLGINCCHRTLHGALLDAEITTDVYLSLTGGQPTLSLDQDDIDSIEFVSAFPEMGNKVDMGKLNVITASDSELNAHMEYLDKNLRRSENSCIWDEMKLDSDSRNTK